MQNRDQIWKDGIRKKLRVHLKWEEKKSLTQLCVFGSKVGLTISQLLTPTRPQIWHFICSFWQRNSLKKKKEKKKSNSNFYQNNPSHFNIRHSLVQAPFNI